MPSPSFITFNEFVNSLFSAPTTPDTSFDEDFKTRIQLIKPQQVQQFVQTLMEYMANRATGTNPKGFLQNEFEEDSFFDFIETEGDVDFSLPNGDYWNESLQSLITYYNEHFNPLITERTINTKMGTTVENGKIALKNGKSFNTDDIKNADAGLAFAKITEDVWTEIVRPWYNVSWDSYYKVREHIDNFAANSKKNLTFTREQGDEEFENHLNYWIRLIMSNNSRRVAVEDLNRNFWVISSTLQAVCAYIWGSNSPIPYMLRNILNELAQLWENIMMLWLAFNLISQKGGRGIKVIVMPLPRTPLQPYRKYDDFITGFPESTFDQEAFVLERIKPIIQKYKYTNLCILPYTRNTNYYYNYYEVETYRGVVFYNCRTEKTTFVPFVATMNGETGKAVYFNPANVANKLYAIRETETYYKWSYPVSNINNIIDNDGNNYQAKRFYGAYRIIPEIKVGYDEKELCIKSLKLTAIDAAAKSLFGTDRKMVSYTLYAPVKESSIAGSFLGTWGENDGDELGNFGIYDAVLKEAYYLGEIPSCTNLSKNRPFFVYSDGVRIVGEGKLIKIGNYLPQNFYTGNYYNDSRFYGEQITPDGQRTTDYLLNLTITGGQSSADKTTVKAIYGNYGSDHVVSSSKCYFFKPKITLSNGNPSYSLTCSEETASSMTTEKYKTVGIDVIADYISKVSTPATITYFIAGVGIQPWHNKPQNDTFQGYWTTTMLTHMFRFVPNIYEKYISREELADGTPVYDTNNVKVGTLQVLGVIDKREAAFSVDGGSALDTFSLEGNRTTWRLPQLIPEKKAQGYIILKEQATQEYYFVDPALSPELKAIYDNAGGGEQGERAVVNAINNDYAAYADQLLTEDNFRFELQNPSGRWCVFDGNTNYAYDNNKPGDTYVKQANRREVAYTTFTYSDGKFVLSSPTQGRKLNVRNWSNCNSSYILPNGGFNDMKFSW